MMRPAPVPAPAPVHAAPPARAARRRRFCALALALLLPAPAQAQAQAAAEYAAKAAFIYNIALFSTFPNPDAPLVRLCVLGRDPFGKLLASLEGKALGQAKMTIAYPGSGGDALRQCQIVFVSASESAGVALLAQSAPQEGVLTVSDAKGAARLGIMVELGVEDKRIAFEYNAEAARAAHITLSSKVLRLARAVH
ncbi:YfiR family protein [Massilia aquatica]|nr:YfiR family protein [Massilia aquatica]